MMGDYSAPSGPGLAPLVDMIRDLQNQLRTLQRPSGVDVGGLLAQVQMTLANINTTVATAISANSYTRAVIDDKIANPPAGSAVTGDIGATGNVTVGGNLPVTGDVLIPNRTAVVSGYFGLWVNSDGRIGISSSARRYKQNIAPRTYTLDQIALIQIVNYRLITAVALLGDKARVEVGVVAEQLISAGMPEFVAFNADGTTESVAYERLNLVAIAGVQQLIGRVQGIEARLTAAKIA